MENSQKKHSTKGIIFDYGGTLDSRGDHWSEIIYEGYLASNLNIDKATFRDAYVYAERELAKHPHIRPEHNFLDLLRIKMKIEMDWLAENGTIAANIINDSAEAVAQYCYRYARKCIEEARPTLEAIVSLGIPMVLVSNFYGNISSVLADFNLTKFFPVIIESAVVGVRKPDPKIFSLGVEAMKMKAEEITVVGDSIRKDILPAQSLGCATAWVKGRSWEGTEETAPDGTITLLQLSDLLASL